MPGDEIPVTVLSGSLGAGKTTLLNHLLEGAGDRQIAVLVNDMGEINVDAELVSGTSKGLAGDVTELSNGCICCELRGDLERAVMRLARERDFDHLVVEASGISEPGPVAKLFTHGKASARYVVDSVVTVVDARQFYDAFGGTGVVERRGAAEDDTRPLSDLLVEQVELANLVVLNKCDLVSETERTTVEELIEGLRPDAEVVTTEYSAVDADLLLGRGLYDPATAAEAAGWRQALSDSDGERAAGDGHSDDHNHDGHSDNHNHDGHTHPEEAYGVTSFVYRRRRPFRANDLAELLSALPPNVVRSKGTLWVAGSEQSLMLGQAGPSVHVEAMGPWIATLPEFEQDAYRRNRKQLEWDETWGDRRTELVFIGTDLDEAALKKRLDDCLLDDDEFETFDPATWNEAEGGFPRTQGERTVLAAPAQVE